MKKNVRLQIGTREKHLLDIFSEKRYIELGTIRIPVFASLLQYKRVPLSDVVDFSILDTGLGSSKLSNPKLRLRFPFWFIKYYQEKNRSMQAMLTHGIFRHVNGDGKEMFAPILLIPIEIQLEKDRFYVQQIAQPMENTVLFSQLKEQNNVEIKKIASQVEKLDSIEAMDQLLQNMKSFGKNAIRLENYITVAYIREPEFVIDPHKFESNKPIAPYISDAYFAPGEANISYFTPLNKGQRQAVYQAANGKSFLITGRLGTGKTTTLAHIALNAIVDNKRVLYVSNNKHTYENVEQIFNKLSLSHVVANFSIPFQTLKKQEKEGTKLSRYDKEIEVEKLTQNIRYVQKYEHSMHERISNFRFVEVLNELAMISDVHKKEIEIDDVSFLVKHEYQRVVKELEGLRRMQKKIRSRHECAWKEIPIHHQIKSKKEIIQMIELLYEYFTLLEVKSKLLEEQFGFTTIENFAKLKNILHDIKRLQLVDVPKSWLIHEESFKEAKEQYRSLRETLFSMHEMEYALENRLYNRETIDITKEIDQITHPFANENMLEFIDTINKERKTMIVLLNKASLHIEVYEKAISKIKRGISWDFNEEDAILDEIIRLEQYLSNHVVTTLIFSIGEHASGKSKLQELQQIANRQQKYRENKEQFRRDYPKAEVTQLAKYIKVASKWPILSSDEKKLMNVFLATTPKKEKDEAIALIQNRLQELEQNLEKELSDMQTVRQLLGEAVEPLADFVEELGAFIHYMDSIELKEAKKAILTFLKSEVAKQDKNALNVGSVFLKTLMVTRKTIQEIEDNVKRLQSFGFVTPPLTFKEKIAYISKVFSYCMNVYASNDRMMLLLKKEELDFIPSSYYYEIKALEESLSKLQQKLNEHTLYPELYGMLYQKTQTNINHIGRSLQNFSSYQDCFQKRESLLNSLQEDNRISLLGELDIIQETSDKLAEVFKQYTKHFKDGVTRYYYSRFDKIVNYLDNLLKEEAKLSTYLGITESLQVLLRFKLPKLVQYVDGISVDNQFVEDFQYTYLKHLERMFLEKFPYLQQTHSLEAVLSVIDGLEKEARAISKEQAINEIRKLTSGKVSLVDLADLDYEGYLRRTNGICQLILSPTQLVNHRFSVEHFDIVLIDDAQLLNANEYRKAMEGKQVIISGELQLQSSIASNLISKMRYHLVYTLSFRFDVTPKRLLNHMDGTRGLIYATMDDNRGTVLTKDSLVDWIVHSYQENPSESWNVFVGSFVSRNTVLEQLVEKLDQMGKTEQEIIDILDKQIFVCDLLDRTMMHAKYNVCNVEDYYHLNTEHIVVNSVDDLLLCQKKCVFIDPNNRIYTEDTRWTQKIRFIVERDQVYLEKPFFNPTILLLKKALENKKIQVFNPHDDLSMLLKKKDRLMGLLIFWDTYNNRYEMLNDYREYYRYFRRNGFEVKIVWIHSLAESVEKVAKEIAKEMEIE